MTFKIGDFPSSNSVTTALSGAGSINNAAQNAVLRANLYKDQMKNIIDTYPMTDTKVSSGGTFGNIGSFIGGAANSGLFDNMFNGSGGGNQFSGRGSSGTDAYGRDFDDPMAGNYGNTSAKNNWWDGFLGGWG